MSDLIEKENTAALDSELDHGSNPFLLAAVSIVAGFLLSVIVLPFILPGLVTSILGPEPKVFWYLSRASAVISYLFLWASMVFGLLLSSRTAKIWPGGFTANDLHQFVSIAGLTAGLFHGLILMGDHYMNITLVQVSAAIRQPELSTGVGWDRPTRVLCVGRNCPFLLHTEKNWHKDLAGGPLHRVFGICRGTGAWGDIRHRLKYTLDEHHLLGQRSERAVPHFLPGSCFR